MHSVLHDQPPALVGSPSVIAVDRVIQRALAKAVSERYVTAGDMAKDLRSCLSVSDTAGVTIARAATRLIVLPFRMLRPDPSVDFLAYSLPDAITVSLSGLESLVVRSSLTASRFGDGQIDLRAIASEANVDAVVTGTLLTAGGQVRVSVQLIELPAGTVRWSHALEVTLEDLFSIQNAVCSAVVSALALPAANLDRRFGQDVPANPEAYSLYLQANRLSATTSQWDEALKLYRRAVEVDPTYAPAWARLGRCLRVIGKYSLGPESAALLAEAEAAFRRAFKLNPDLSLTHHLYTHLEVDCGRALHAMLRLLERVEKHTTDPDLYAGLLHACRYVGLLDASVSAYDRAKRLDPSIRTSVAHSFFMQGEFVRAVEADINDPPYVRVMSLLSSGRPDEALAVCRASWEKAPSNNHLTLVLEALTSAVSNRYDQGRAAIARLLEFPVFTDPEGWYYWALAAAAVRDDDNALGLLSRAVASGFCCVRGFETSPQLDPLRSDPRFNAILQRAIAAHAVAARAFADAGGHRLLGLPGA
ncbi:MAG TPA: hypothetical protein VLD67_21725, partial [Vicinamibacterales bacterium]|nr:hypothetical protein [Vicinamibacterales bacterium]